MVAFIVIYMLFYAVIHSLLAGRGKSAFRAQFGDRNYFGLYRLLYNAFAIITLIPVLWTLIQPSPEIWVWPETLYPVLTLIQVISAAGLLISLIQTDVLRFAGIKQGWTFFTGGTLPLPDEKMQVGGVYALVRHPLYLFAMMSMWSVPEMNLNYFVFNLAASLYFVLGAYFEEQRLIKGFGDAYRAYQKRVHAFIPIPRSGNRFLQEDQ